jgi:hypothetical protein
MRDRTPLHANRGVRHFGSGDIREGIRTGGNLVFVFFDDDGFKVLGFKDLAAIETFDVVYAIAASDDLGVVVVTGGLHKQHFIEIYSNRV